MTIFLDLDGTLLDTKERYIALFHDFLQIPDSTLSQTGYWNLKRAGKSDRQILLSLDPVVLNKKIKNRLDAIEGKKYLNMDKLYPGSEKLLSELKGQKLVLVTFRKNHKNLLDQLYSFKIGNFFEEILYSREPLLDSIDEKSRIIRKSSRFSSKKSLLVGDTEIEYAVSKRLGIPIILVTYGLRSKNFLKKKCPDAQFANSPYSALAKIKTFI